MEYTLIYDASSAAFSWKTILSVGFLLIAGLVFLVVSIKIKRGGWVIFMTFWLSGVVLFGGIGSGNVVYQHLKCKQWTESRSYKVVEGVVEDFQQMPKSGHAREQFTVNNVTFEFSDYDLSKGGFNNTSSHGSPIREGLPVRIAYRDERILKLEVRKKKEHSQHKNAADGESRR